MKPQCIIALSVKTGLTDTSEIFNTWKNDFNEPIDKCIHSFTAKCYNKSDCITLSNLKSCNCFFSTCYFWFLTGYLCQSHSHTLNIFLVRYSIFDSHINNNFSKPWKSHRIFNPKLTL